MTPPAPAFVAHYARFDAARNLLGATQRRVNAADAADANRVAREGCPAGMLLQGVSPATPLDKQPWLA